MQSIISALYCKILVILGLAFPLAEVMAADIPRGFYQLFYVYLFLGSLLFLTYTYVDLMKTRALAAVSKSRKSKRGEHSWLGRVRELVTKTAAENNSSSHEVEELGESCNDAVDWERLLPRPKQIYGSFYIRMGAVCK